MKLMPCRLDFLRATYYGFLKTFIPLVKQEQGMLLPTFQPTGTYIYCSSADDIGMYVIIPKLAYYANVSFETALSLFFYTVLLLPACIGWLGIMLVFRSLPQRIISTIIYGLLIKMALHANDVYLWYYACNVAFIPWIIYFFQNQHSSIKFLSFFSFALGFCINLAHWMRGYSGFGTLIFFSIMAYKKYGISKKGFTLLALPLLGGLLISHAYFTFEQYRASSYYQNTLHIQYPVATYHPFWHTIFLGFAFLKSHEYQIEWNDQFALQHAKKVNSTLNENDPQAYEATLRSEVLHILFHRTKFFMMTLFAKLGILLFYLLKYINLGLMCAYLRRKPFFLDAAFCATACFYAIFPLIAIPIYIEYALGFIVICALYGLISINYALQEIPSLSAIFSFFTKIRKKAPLLT